MSTSEELLQADLGTTIESDPAAGSAEFGELLRRAFGVELTILDGLSGEVLRAASGQPARDWDLRSEVCREVARRGRVELIDDEDPFLGIALPMALANGSSQVAVGTFISRLVGPDENLSQAAALLDMRPEEAVSWASRQVPWSADPLRRVGEMVIDRWVSVDRIKKLEEEAESLSDHLARTYEEISLLYRLTQNLKISETDEDLGQVALEWMEEVLPAEGLAIQLVPVAQEADSLNHQVRTEPVLLTFGDCPVDNREFTALIDHLGPDAAKWPVVVNRRITEQDNWPCRRVRQMIAVSLAEGENLFGWLAALNHADDAEFGTVEASLLSSVAAILGIHGGNIELYRQQSELLAGIVRALTSAIDAKDPYTRGHSDRVARVAVRLAEQLNCDPKTLNTIYLSGLLHDIGKIGIDDSVLRKPGKLSEPEYEHITKHAAIGHRILQDIRKLDDVLPVVLHHHEAWDGGGYPDKLRCDAIPLSARILAVADAFDAMGSDRPYRERMPDEKIDGIFRSGAGQQWDPEVVEAFFAARDDIRRIVRGEQENVEIPLQQWS
jgi:HD-GYP domain-containing protein (c-di-GMP phosphodiesterase class II)